MYPPEIVVLVTPNVSKAAQSVLHPALSTRILTVEPIGMPVNAMDSKVMSATATTASLQNLRHYDNHCPGLTKLTMFQLTQYDSILYIDSDCLVVQDVSHLLDLGKVYLESEALIAAAPDICPPDKFNSGVMVLRPNQQVFDNMMGQRSFLTTSDRSDTGFLNAYFSEWFTAMPPQARLSFGYNAQQVLHAMTATTTNSDSNDGHLVVSHYWDMVVGPNLYIVHYSSSRKPWEAKRKGENKDGAASPTTTTTADLHLHHAPHHRTDLEELWHTWHQKSKNYLTRFKKESQQEQQAKEQALVRQQQQRQQQRMQQQKSAAQAANDPKVIAKLIRKRFKELRVSGMGIKEAMQQARLELQPEQDPRDAGSQVASMFGL